MNSKTIHYKEKLNSIETVEERLEYLKNQYKGKTAVILAPGPTLKDHNLTSLKDRDDIVILAIKQAYDEIKGQADFHIVNTYNFDKYKGYDYENEDTIIFYGLSKSYIPQQMEKLATKPHPCDIWVPVMNPPYITYEQCMHKAGDWDKLLMLQEQPHTWWGTSILFEQAIPMALLIGCERIVTVGWDLSTGTHSYDYKKVDFTPNAAENKYTNDSIYSTKGLYDWINIHNLELQIVSHSNPADERFERINICQI